jgi:phage-related minor tail protein
MTDQMKVQAAVEVSTENAESALKRVGDAAGQMAERMQREGDKAGAAVDGIGSGASKSADEFSRAEGRIAASIKRATTNLELLGKSASQKLEFKIEERGLDKAKFDPLLSKLRELELRSQEASKAASASLDKVGISAAQTAAALRGVPAQFTDIATSIAGGQAPLTVFLQQGGQLKDMFGGAGAAAKALGGYVVGLLTPLNLAVAAIGGIGYAAYAGASEMDEFKKNLVLTGNISGITTDKFNAMAAAMSNISGITRGAAAEALTAMAASGNIGSASIQKLTEAALKFEKAGGPAVAETAKQFEELGKSPVDASVKLSEKTHYLTLAVYEQIKALQDQGKTSEAAAVAQNAWADAIDKRTPQMVENLGLIQRAWDNIKRSASGTWDFMKDIGRDSTAAEQMADLRNKIAEADKDIAAGSINSNRLKQQKEQYRQELQALVDHNNAKEAEAKKRAADEAKNQAQISATSDADALIKSQRSKREQHAAELKKLDQQRSSDLLSEEKYQQAKAALAKKYEEKPASAPKRTEAEKELARMAKLDAEESSRRIANAQRVGAEMNKETEAIWAKVEAENAAREAIGLSKSGIESRTLAIMQEQLAWRDALGLEDEQTEQLKRNIAAQRALVDAAVSREATQGSFDSAKQAAKDVEEAHKKAAEKAAAEWQKTVDTIDGTFHDAFTDMLKQGEADWESFTDSLATTFKSAVADEIYKMTLKPLVLNVVGSFSGAGAPAVPGADGQPLSISNGFGVISGVQTAWAGMSGGITNAANSFALSGMGQAAGLSTTAAMGPPTAAGVMGGPATVMTSSGSSFVASAAPYAAAIAALAYGDHLMKAGWGLDNNRKGYAASAAGAVAGGVAAGASAGASAGSSVGPVGTVVGAVVGAIAVPVLDRLFGHNNKTNADAAGIQGSFDLSGFTGDQWQQFSKKGGTFRSDKRWTDTYDVSSDIDKELDSAFRKTVAKLQDMGKTLGVETSKSIDGFTHEFSLQLSENGDMSKAGEKLAAEIGRAADGLVAKMVPNIDEFARLGESASQTFSRLNQEVAATDAILLAMGKNAAEAFGGVGLASIAARENLIDLAGGLDALASKTQSFYANFYSAEEQVQLAATHAQKALTEGFADIGQSIPATREAFRALVESQDLSTEAGRKLWNSLLDLQDEFDAVADGADATASKLKEATTAAQQGQASLFDTFATDAQKLSAAQKLVNDAFAGLGKTVPATAGDFLNLTQAIDPASEAGQSLITTLDKVSGAFAYIQTAATAAADASIAAINNARNTSARGYFSGIDLSSAQSGYMGEGQAAIDKLFGSISEGAITAAQTAADAAATAASGWKSAAQSIKSSLENIRSGSLSGLSPEARYNLLKSQFATTSAAARGGNLEAAGNLGQIASDFLSASRDYNASSEAFQQDRASADAALDESLKYAGAQVSLQQSIADASKASVTQLQTMNQTLTGFAANAQELLQKSYAGADRGTATAAVGKLADVQAMVDKWFADTSAGFVQSYAGGTLMRLEGNNAQFTDARGATSYVRAGESALDLAKRIAAFKATWESDFGVKLPSYAVGTPFVPQDQIAQIHQGEMIIPAATASQLRKYGIGSQPDNGLQAEMLAEMRATRQAQQQSYAGMQQQLAASNAKLAEVSKRLAAMEDQARLTRAGQ